MQEQPRPVKFNFDNVFGSKGAAAPAAPRARSSYSATEVEAIRGEMLAQGKSDAEAVATAARATALGAIAHGLTAIIGQMDATAAALREESAALALEVGCKLANAALAALPLKEVEALVADCLHKLHREPRLVVRASSECAEALRQDIDALCQEHGYAGRVIIIAEPALSGADCRVEWADGGVERDLSLASTAIEECFSRWRATPSVEEN